MSVALLFQLKLFFDIPHNRLQHVVVLLGVALILTVQV